MSLQKKRRCARLVGGLSVQDYMKARQKRDIKIGAELRADGERPIKIG